MADLLARSLAPAEIAALREHLAGCADCAAEVAELEELWQLLGEPPVEIQTPKLRRRFEAMLAREIDLQGRRVLPFGRRRRSASRTGWSGSFGGFGAVAAALLLVAVGLYLGTQLSSRQSSREMAVLQQEVRSLHETVALALLAEGSATKRLEGVAYGRDFSAGDDKVAGALFEAMLHDPNVNVRLAALDALRPRIARDSERPRLVAAVAEQDSPLVQLSLIALLIESDGDGARRDLAQLLDHPNLDPVVRGYLRDRLGRRI